MLTYRQITVILSLLDRESQLVRKGMLPVETSMDEGYAAYVKDMAYLDGLAAIGNTLQDSACIQLPPAEPPLPWEE